MFYSKKERKREREGEEEREREKGGMRMEIWKYNEL